MKNDTVLLKKKKKSVILIFWRDAGLDLLYSHR